jgi:serine protease Do
MDDFYKDLFGENKDEAKKAEEPVIHEVEGVPAEPVASEPVQSEPVQKAESEYRYIPPQPSQPVNPPQYRQGGVYYQPPVQNNNQYYNPNQQMPGAMPPQPPKKRRSVGVIIMIAVICACVAVGGLFLASKLDSGSSSGSSSSSSSQQDDSKDDKSDNTSDSASASVKSSDEAAKEDGAGNFTAAGVAEKAKDSCVGITVYTEQNAYSYFYNYGNQQSDSGEKTASGEGSGVIMSEADGKTYIMTCAHVIADGSSFTVTLDNDKEYEAEMVGYDSQTDIGVLAIKATGLQIAEFGDSKDIEVGEYCIAIGCPGGLTFKNSVTMGIVSALDVPVSSSIGYSNECIQVDAAINPGNSGGALFNMQGQVIGINSSKIASTDYEGMGFAVPSNTAVETANSLIRNGYVAGRAKIGIQYNTLENYNSASSILSALAQKGYENANGTMVIQVIDDDSDLKNKDVQQYDMIVAVEGKTLTSVDVLTSVLSKSKPGDKIKLTIARIEGNRINTFDVECKLMEAKQ